MRRTIIAVSSVAAVAAASVGIAWAAAPSQQQATSAARISPPTVQGSMHLVRLIRQGPSAVYDTDTGSIGLTEAIRFRVPDNVNIGTVRMSFEYRTTGSGQFTVGPIFRQNGHRVRIAQPTPRHLAPSSGFTSATVEFRARLFSGDTYGLVFTANVNRSNLQPASIHTRRMLVVVEGWR